MEDIYKIIIGNLIYFIAVVINFTSFFAIFFNIHKNLKMKKIKKKIDTCKKSAVGVVKNLYAIEENSYFFPLPSIFERLFFINLLNECRQRFYIAVIEYSINGKMY
ncbi:MAG: hypothetical protein K6G26_03335, partial [Lachnospiraceae bacterium]|nr:hypothetical protein [Lachnospiraceae bacterium]